MITALKRAIIEGQKHQYLLAKTAGISETVFSRIVCGRRLATPEERKRIAKALEKTELEIFGGVNSKNSRRT